MKRTELKRRTPLKARTPLKRVAFLKSKTPIKKVSAKQAKRNRELAKIEPPEDGRCQNPKCHKLPDFRGLQKHHKIFRSLMDNDNLENIIWLCGNCHDKEHGIKNISG